MFGTSADTYKYTSIACPGKTYQYFTSMDCLKGKPTGNHRFSQNMGFSCKFPFNQFIDYHYFGRFQVYLPNFECPTCLVASLLGSKMRRQSWTNEFKKSLPQFQWCSWICWWFLVFPSIQQTLQQSHHASWYQLFPLTASECQHRSLRYCLTYVT